MAVSVGAEPARAKAMSVSSEARPARAKATPVSRERFVIPVDYGGAWPGFNPTRRATHQRPGTAGVEGAGGSGGPGCGGRGRWRGLAGLRDDAPSHTSATRHRRCGGRRRVRRARLRRPWAVAGPGRASRRRAEPHISDQAPPVWRAPEGPEGTGGLRDRPLRAAGSRVAISRAAGPDGAWNTSGAQANRPYSPPPGSERPV